MAIAPLSIRQDYWDTFEIQEKDLDFLYNYLLEEEIPLTPIELAAELVLERIEKEKKSLEEHLPAQGSLYTPRTHYQVGDKLTFPALDWKQGKVLGLRLGNNPELTPFEVIEVEFPKGIHRLFATGLEEHRLNQPIEVRTDDPLLDADEVMQRYGEKIAALLEAALEKNPDLVRVAGIWFPRALLVDVNTGHLNLAEAVLDMAGGGPLPTEKLMEQIELPTDVNSKLTEFSLNLALQEDGRFDEVGPSGAVLWFLQRLEPEELHHPPTMLRYHAQNYDPAALTPEMVVLERELDDELSDLPAPAGRPNAVTLPLIFPHWRSGTLPLTPRVESLFPTAYESPRIQFTLVDSESGERYPGWIVRPLRLVYGLGAWYQSQGLIPGSLVTIQRGRKPGEVIVRTEKRRSAREWIRTVLVGADGGIVYAMLKQMVNATFDERMAIAVPDREAIDAVWELTGKQRQPFDRLVLTTMRELAKLNPQGHIHAQELYASVNVLRRCPPGPIFALLTTHKSVKHVGDLYYRLEDSALEEGKE